MMKPILNDNFSELYNFEVTKENSIKLLPTDQMTENDKISILSDAMFKTLFCNSERLYFGAKFLSYFIDYSYEDILNNIKLAKTELNKKVVTKKSERCDYVAILNDTLFNIEINCNSSKENMQRNMDYAFRQFGSKVKVGKKYKFTKVIQINVNNFSFKELDKIIDIYTIKNDENILLTKDITFIQIYIPNINKKCYTKGIENLSEFERFILSLSKTDKQEAKEITLGDELMNKLLEEQIVYGMPEDLRESYNHELAMKDEGRREGIKEAQIEIINKMFKNGMSVKEISAVLEMPSKEIEKSIKGA